MQYLTVIVKTVDNHNLDIVLWLDLLRRPPQGDKEIVISFNVCSWADWNTSDPVWERSIKGSFLDEIEECLLTEREVTQRSSIPAALFAVMTSKRVFVEHQQQEKTPNNQDIESVLCWQRRCNTGYFQWTTYMLWLLETLWLQNKGD